MAAEPEESICEGELKKLRNSQVELKHLVLLCPMYDLYIQINSAVRLAALLEEITRGRPT